MVKRFLWILLCVALGDTAKAGNDNNPASIIKLSDRVFDMRADVQDLRREDDFIPLRDVDWLNGVINEDSVLKRIVVHIRSTNRPIKDYWPTLEPDSQYPVPENIPADFMLTGFQTRSTSPKYLEFLILPTDAPTDFNVRCTAVALPFVDSCFLSASYPPDPKIYLLARVYHPGSKPFPFREIAQRMREIAYCLDVTDKFNNDGFKPAPYVNPSSALPTLRNCQEQIS